MRLAEAVELLREDLFKAIEAASDQTHALTFDVASAEIELSVVLTQESGASAKMVWSVIPAILSGEVGAQGKLGRDEIHRVKLQLKPTVNGKDVKISRKV